MLHGVVTSPLRTAVGSNGSIGFNKWPTLAHFGLKLLRSEATVWFHKTLDDLHAEHTAVRFAEPCNNWSQQHPPHKLYHCIQMHAYLLFYYHSQTCLRQTQFFFKRASFMTIESMSFEMIAISRCHNSNRKASKHKFMANDNGFCKDIASIYQILMSQLHPQFGIILVITYLYIQWHS